MAIKGKRRIMWAAHLERLGKPLRSSVRAKDRLCQMKSKWKWTAKKNDVSPFSPFQRSSKSQTRPKSQAICLQGVPDSSHSTKASCQWTRLPSAEHDSCMAWRWAKGIHGRSACSKNPQITTTASLGRKNRFAQTSSFPKAFKMHAPITASFMKLHFYILKTKPVRHLLLAVAL